MYTMQVCAQNVVLFNSKQGLANSCISRIYEDSRHSVWIATKNGLNREDGVKMNIYRHDENDPHSIIHDEPTCIFEYDRNHILIGTGAGLSVYNYPTDNFTYIPFVGVKGDTVKVNTIDFCMINDNGKKRYLMTISGYGNGEIFCDNNGQFSIKHITEFNIDPNTSPNSILQDKKNRIWIISNREKVYQRQGKKFKSYPEISNAIKMTISNLGILYVATDRNGIYRYEDSQDRFVQVAAPNEFGGVISNINPWRETHNNLLVCTDGGGLRIFDEKTKEVSQSSLKMNDFNLATANVKDAMFDTSGNLWVGIYMRGLMMKPNSKSSFEYIGRLSITKNSIGSSSVFAIAKAADSNHIWVAPDNDGIYYMASDGSSSKHYSKNDGSNCPAAFTTMYQPTAPNSPLLLGTFFDGLWQFSGGTFSLITKDINKIFDIYPADNDNVWIATMGQGIYYYNPRTKEYIQYASDFSKGEEGTRLLNNPYDYCILPVGNRLFIGTADGLCVGHYSGNGKLTGKSDVVFRTYSIRHICPSADKKSVWVATNYGLYLVDCKTLEYTRYSTADGLANNSVEALSLQGNNLWVATDDGLSCFDIKQKTFTNFYQDDGVQDNEFNRGAIISLNNNIYFGGIGGICYFDPAKILNDRVKSKGLRIKFVDLLIGGTARHKGDMSGGYQILNALIDDCAKFEVSNRDNHFILHLCVEGAQNRRFSYEYSVNDDEWKCQGPGVNRLIFDNLKPGNYKVRIRGTSFNTVTEERILEFTVHAPWYASWWAKLLYFIILVILAHLAYIYVKRQVAAQKVLARHRQEQQINEARIQFFMNISHEIRTPMTLILAPLEKLLNIDKDAECQRNYKLMKQNADRILRLINQMMDVRKIEQGKYLLDYHKTELVALVQNVFDVFKTQAESRNINYTFLHPVLDNLMVYVDPENMDKIIMNLLSNAFKFTPDGGTITLELTAKPDANGVVSTFNLFVTDSGKGIKDVDKPKVFERFYSSSRENGYMGTGIGLNLTSLLVELHKGQITVHDNPTGTGTQFAITLPVGDDSLQTMLPAPLQTTQEPVEEDKKETAEEETQNTPLQNINSYVILVEDDPSIREYVHEELANELSVMDFSNGQQAWDYIIANPQTVSLIISDIMMPVMDGLTLCQKVKSNFNTNHLPIVLMTALGSDADRIVGITNGADAYVTKPFNIDVLRTTVIGLMRNRQLLQGRFQGEKLKEANIEEIEVESPDESLMRRIMKVINDNMDNDELSVEMIADKVGISRVHFYRKMKDLTGQAPREFIKYIRLKEAARLLGSKKMDITGVSIATGFKSPSAFSTSFKSLYGLTPTEWMKKQNEEPS